MVEQKENDKKFVLTKSEMIDLHNDYVTHPDVELVHRLANGQRLLEKTANIRSLLGKEDGEKPAD